MISIGILNAKGGVGKTTFSTMLAIRRMISRVLDLSISIPNRARQGGEAIAAETLTTIRFS